MTCGHNLQEAASFLGPFRDAKPFEGGCEDNPSRLPSEEPSGDQIELPVGQYHVVVRASSEDRAQTPVARHPASSPGHEPLTGIDLAAQPPLST